MFARILIAALAVLGITWSRDTQAVQNQECEWVDAYVNGVYQYSLYLCSGGGGGSGGNGDTPPDVWNAGGGNYGQTCQSLRGERPDNCDDTDPGNPADFPNSADAISIFNPYFGVPPDLRMAFDHFFGCVGGGHNSVQGCAEEIYRETFPTCSYQNCYWFSDDLLRVMGTAYIDDYVRDSVTWSIAWPAQIGVTPDFDMFPEWVKEAVSRSRAQMDCHLWHDRMQSAGCAP